MIFKFDYFITQFPDSVSGRRKPLAKVALTRSPPFPFRFGQNEEVFLVPCFCFFVFILPNKKGHPPAEWHEKKNKPYARKDRTEKIGQVEQG